MALPPREDRPTRFPFGFQREEFCPSDFWLSGEGGTLWGDGDVGEVAFDHFFEGAIQPLSQVVDPLHGDRSTELVGL